MWFTGRSTFFEFTYGSVAAAQRGGGIKSDERRLSIPYGVKVTQYLSEKARTTFRKKVLTGDSATS